MDYTQVVTDKLQDLLGLQAEGRKATVEFCVDGLIPGHNETKRVRDYAANILQIKPNDFNAALRVHYAAAAGFTASTPKGFIDEMVKKQGITARFNGLLHMNAIPLDLQKKEIEPNQWDNPELRALMRQFRGPTDRQAFELDCRTTCVEYGRPFKKDDINDAVSQWFRGAVADRLSMVERAIEYAGDRKARDAQVNLRALAEAAFTCPHGADYVAAVFSKFIWQVKRKIAGLKVTDHLMPVVLGSQGCGKSTLLKQMLAPVDELSVTSDFSQVTDDRNIDLFRNYAIFLDEMAHATRSDMATVKNIVTADTLTRRVMRSNGGVTIAQNATFIGAANADDLSELIVDPSGVRRFAALHMKDGVKHEIVNAFDWLTVWRSVDENAADPMAGLKTELRAAQELERVHTPFEDWHADLSPNKFVRNAHMSASDLYADFRQFEITGYPANRGTSIQAFVRQLRRSTGQIGARFGIEVVNGGSNSRYFWLG